MEYQLIGLKITIKYITNKKGSISNPTSPNFRLDDVIPIGSYYVMKKNGLSFKNCLPSNNIMILFSVMNPGYIGSNELDLLQKRVGYIIIRSSYSRNRRNNI